MKDDAHISKDERRFGKGVAVLSHYFQPRNQSTKFHLHPCSKHGRCQCSYLILCCLLWQYPEHCETNQPEQIAEQGLAVSSSALLQSGTKAQACKVTAVAGSSSWGSSSGADCVMLPPLVQVTVGCLIPSTGCPFSARALEDAVSAVLWPLIFCSSCYLSSVRTKMPVWGFSRKWTALRIVE